MLAMDIRILRYTVLFISILLLQNSCKKDTRLLFDKEAHVYFGQKIEGSSLIGSDSINYSFAFSTEDITQDTIYVQCRIMGLPADRDRNINIVADENNDAVQGYHYKILSSVIPAGKYDNEIPIVVYRQQGLQDSVVSAILRIEDSEDFKAGYNDVGAVGPVYRNKYPRREFKFTITDRLTKPANWDSSWQSVFGEYSEVKIRFISNATAFTEWSVTVFPQDRNFIIKTAYYALYEYEQSNVDLIDENGKPVKFY